MKRNLCRDCKICKHNGSSLLVCADLCNAPIRLLEEIESARNTYEEANQKIQNVKNNFVNNLFTN